MFPTIECPRPVSRYRDVHSDILPPPQESNTQVYTSSVLRHMGAHFDTLLSAPFSIPKCLCLKSKTCFSYLASNTRVPASGVLDTGVFNLACFPLFYFQHLSAHVWYLKHRGVHFGMLPLALFPVLECLRLVSRTLH